MTDDPVSGTPRGSAPRGGHPCVHLEGGCGISSQCTTRGHSGRSGSLVTPYVAGQSFSEVPTQITSGRSETRPAPLPSVARRGVGSRAQCTASGHDGRGGGIGSPEVAGQGGHGGATLIAPGRSGGPPAAPPSVAGGGVGSVGGGAGGEVGGGGAVGIVRERR